MSKEGFCKDCKQGRCNMCRGYRNGNKKLRCLCRHTKEEPALESIRGWAPQGRPSSSELKQVYPMVYDVELARLLLRRELPPEVEII